MVQTIYTWKLTFCNSSLDTAIPNIKVEPPNTNAVAIAKAFPTTIRENYELEIFEHVLKKSDKPMIYNNCPNMTLHLFC